MGTDTYNDFRHLAENEVLNRDYQILVQDRQHDITIVAPHGGGIEPTTSVIARKIAGDRFNCYCFEGIKPDKNSALHITSHRFDEPQALGLVSKSAVIITVHACSEKKEVIHMGGRFMELIKHIQKELETFCLPVSQQHDKFPGKHLDNICNKGQLKKGVQLEISRGLRDNPDKIHIISTAVNTALKTFKSY